VPSTVGQRYEYVELGYGERERRRGWETAVV
jgi:hypothetical protein